MKKTYNHENFTFETLTHGKITIFCNGYENAKNWGHEAQIITERAGDVMNETRAKIVYHNRTWESFTFETLLYEIIERALPKKSDAAEREFIAAQIRAIAARKSEEAAAWAAAFSAAYNALSPETKERTARALEGKTLNSVEDAENILIIAAALDVVQA